MAFKALLCSFLIILSLSQIEAVETLKATAVLHTKDATVLGTVTFEQVIDGSDGCEAKSKNPVQVRGRINPDGNAQAVRGFHIHQYGNLAVGESGNPCDSAGPHFNPEAKDHGGPNDATRHVGDLGNLQFDAAGVANILFTDNIISLIGKHSVIGRAVVLHSGPDDFGKGGSGDSLKTGNAGSRVACGIIGWAS